MTMRIPHFLDENHVCFETMIHPPAYTAQRLARRLQVSVSELVKSVLLHGPTGYVVAVLPATQRVDLAAAMAILGRPLRLAQPVEIASLFRDCQWGNVVPFGTLYGVPTIVDDAIDPDGTIVFSAHRHFLAIRMRYRDFATLERPQRCRFAEGPSEPAAKSSCLRDME
jgi:Ala-tRNA(Pro) deacylase